MIVHPDIHVLALTGNTSTRLDDFFSYLGSMRHMHVSVMQELPEDLSGYDVIVTTETSRYLDASDSLESFVNAGKGWLGLVDLSDKPLPPIFGVRPQAPGPEAEIRIIFQDSDNPLAVRMPDAAYAGGRFQALEATLDDVECVLYADWHYQHKAVLTSRTAGKGLVACTTLQDYDHPFLQQVLYRIVKSLFGKQPESQTPGVGILGYAPSVGQYHGIGASTTEGLALRAVCDLNPARLQQARVDFKDIQTYESSDAFAGDPSVDIVIVATAPNTHARLCLDMLNAGKHVICEKPLALTRQEAQELEETSQHLNLHLSCNQNRRWDVDYLAIRQALAERLIGDVFYMETFVGGFSHPCGYWHSHAPVSGGTAYDWGGHYIDWIVSLIEDRPVSVICTSHKRVWHDVTNNDQERILVGFSGGQEAEFMHSDIAAIRKPKWYLLGTKGAIVGHWKDVTTFDIDPVLYFHRNNIPATEMPPELTVRRRLSEGEITEQSLPLPPRPDFAFHRNLADHLLTGEPIETPLSHSVVVVKILEAASQSAAQGGKEVIIDG